MAFPLRSTGVFSLLTSPASPPFFLPFFATKGVFGQAAGHAAELFPLLV